MPEPSRSSPKKRGDQRIFGRRDKQGNIVDLTRDPVKGFAMMVDPDAKPRIPKFSGEKIMAEFMQTQLDEEQGQLRAREYMQGYIDDPGSSTMFEGRQPGDRDERMPHHMSEFIQAKQYAEAAQMNAREIGKGLQIFQEGKRPSSAFEDLLSRKMSLVSAELKRIQDLIGADPSSEVFYDRQRAESSAQLRALSAMAEEIKKRV